MEQKVEIMPSEVNNESTPKLAIKTSFTIFRAAPSVCEGNRELYEPKMVSIGPFHRIAEIEEHKKLSLSDIFNSKMLHLNSDSDKKEVSITLKGRITEMEGHKKKFLSAFLKRTPSVAEEVYKNKITKLLDTVRTCYSENVELDEEMLLQDGCFILEFLLKLEEDDDILLRRGWDPVTILSDLLLLENQIPFSILENLYAIVRENNKNLPDLKNLVKKNLFLKYLHDGIDDTDRETDTNKNTNTTSDGESEKTHHLLHLYHQLSRPSHETNIAPGNPYLDKKNTTKKRYNVPQVIPCATQLLEFGVRLRRNIRPRDIFHVTFEDTKIHHPFSNGDLKIPQLVIDPTRRTLLMNLLAFEKCVPESQRRWTGLLILMNCIMKHKKDLEILQRSGILLNLFPSEEEAIKFVGQLSERVTIDFNSHYYTDLFQHVNKNCDTRMAKYRASFMHQYFNNPWAVISFASSMLAITLTIVQTLISYFTYRNRFRH